MKVRYLSKFLMACRLEFYIFKEVIVGIAEYTEWGALHCSLTLPVLCYSNVLITIQCEEKTFFVRFKLKAAIIVMCVAV
jgi:hypothetical protein